MNTEAESEYQDNNLTLSMEHQHRKQRIELGSALMPSQASPDLN